MFLPHFKAVKMSNLQCNLIIISFTSLFMVELCSALDQKTIDDFDTSKAMVSFNPYVSVLDKQDASRYKPTDLIPLIEKMATRFNKIHIKFSKWDINGRSSLTNTSLAVALYNCPATRRPKLEVFLEIDLSFYPNQGTNHIEKLNKFRKLINLGDKANAACSGTVSSIIVEEKSTHDTNFCLNMEEYMVHLKQDSRFNYSLGFSVSEYDYCDLVSKCKHVIVDVWLIKRKNNLLNFTKLSCKPYSLTQDFTLPLKLITSYMVSDTVDYAFNTYNMTHLVYQWKQTLTLQSDVYLISFAFDYYEPGDIFWSTGWWYLIKDPGNANTSEYVFEERINVASQVDFKENPKNFEWLEQNHTFDVTSTGIVSPRQTSANRVIFRNFCRVMILNEIVLDSELSTDSFCKTLISWGFLGTCSNFLLYHLPIFTSEDATSSYKLREGLSLSMFLDGPLNVSVYALERDRFTTKYGYAYPLRLCHEDTNSQNLNRFSNKINELSVELIIFYFHVDHRSVHLGTTNLVRQNKVMFEKCKTIVISKRKKSVEISFVILGYFKKDKFYTSPDTLQNYVKYMYLLEDWAKNQTNTVVFLGQLEDEEISLKQSYRDASKVAGWMSFNPSTRSYISKREEALKLSMLHYPNPVYNITEIVKTVNITTTVFERSNVTTGNETGLLTGNQVFLIVFISLVVAMIIIAIVIILVYRCYKNNNITNVEIGIFLNGDNQSDNEPHKIPYDKEKYEISGDHFKIESEGPLGTGEFGAVYRGTIDQIFGKLQVAVKTSNPQRVHKTQITGLLSEIKVLAYIGKHENITELLGANTESLKKGKVYIFLEFCHLGSLQKYLQQMRALLSSPIQETNVDLSTSVNSYVNSCAENAKVLDSALSYDLYKWSTEICNGMSFLAKKHVVHADLATRNVLLNLRREAKICDFGLSRRMYNYTNYVKTQQEPLPWKWMAPESLRDMIFNEKTDVWAFGVTLWEIYSLASNPYAGLSWDANFSQMLERGLRLSEPEYCERDMYERMQKCWNSNPDNRPTFSEMLLTLQPSDGEPASK